MSYETLFCENECAYTTPFFTVADVAE